MVHKNDSGSLRKVQQLKGRQNRVQARNVLQVWQARNGKSVWQITNRPTKLDSVYGTKEM